MLLKGQHAQRQSQAEEVLTVENPSLESIPETLIHHTIITR